MITCGLTYWIDPDQVEAFERYAKAWIHLVNCYGGQHHGYWMPHEGANDVAYCHFSFPSLAAYEEYRGRIADDADCEAVSAFARENKIIRRYERTFTRPVLNGASPAELGIGA